jgi:hypothetical protein
MLLVEQGYNPQWEKVEFREMGMRGRQKMDLDVKYDFVPANRELLYRMRLMFWKKKDKVVELVHRKLKNVYVERRLKEREFRNKYCREDGNVKDKARRERYAFYGGKDKQHMNEVRKEEDAMRLYIEGSSEIGRMWFNEYARKFVYYFRYWKPIDDLYLYDMEGKR